MIYKFSSLLVQVEPVGHLLRWQWRGPVSFAGFQEAFTQLIRCSEKHGITRWLADTSHMPPVGIDEQAWLSEVWLAQFASLRVRHLALIQPAGLHNQLVVENLLADGCRQVRADVQFFSDSAGALDWLLPSALVISGVEQEWQQVQHTPGKLLPIACTAE